MQETRNTVQRQLVLDAVRHLTNHPTADEIYASIHKAHPHISRATVYRNLAFLAQHGDIRRVSHLNAADRFDFELKPHYHFICKSCGNVHDAPLEPGPNLLEAIAPQAGFEYHSYEITFTGLCPGCSSPAGSTQS